MSRLQTKCVFGSGLVHGLLLAMLVVGSAFMRTPEKQDKTHFIPIFRESKITDDETQGGGNPNVPSNVTPAPAPPPIPQPAAPVVQEPPIQTPKVTIVEQPPEPKPKQQKQDKKKTPRVETPPDKPKVVKNPNSPKIVPKNTLVEKPPEIPKPQHQIEANTDTVKKAAPDPNIEKLKQERLRAAKEERDRLERERRAQERARLDAIEQANREYKQRMDALGTIVGNVENKMSSGVAIEMPGPGGEAFVNYADLIWTKYYQAWQTPDSHDVRTPVKVEIVVARDGRVLSSNIVRSSGDSKLDKSVRQALDRVTKLPPFPEGAKDPQRTFRINFELKSKRQFG